MIDRYECTKCGWWADISDDKDEAYFSTEVCPECKGKLNKIGPVNKV